MPLTDDVAGCLLQNIDDDESRRQLFALIYEELKNRAAKILAGHQNPSLSATVLVHEAYLKLINVPIAAESKDHFFSLASRAMRQIMVDHARYRLYQKRDRRLQVTLAEDIEQSASVLPDLIGIDIALHRLRDEDEDLVDLVQLHFFGGLGFAEIADMKGISLSTVERMWRTARQLLRDFIK